MSSRPITGAVPPFLVLAGHPLRWRMLVELAGSDRQVGELTRAVGQPQGLVSYHLARLRDGGLVSSHKSSFDGRAVYYRVHLDRCGELLAATGAALHPGLPSSGQRTRARRGRGMGVALRVLFVCTGNGTRSQIAEALLRDKAGETSRWSAPEAIRSRYTPMRSGFWPSAASTSRTRSQSPSPGSAAAISTTSSRCATRSAKSARSSRATDRRCTGASKTRARFPAPSAPRCRPFVPSRPTWSRASDS